MKQIDNNQFDNKLIEIIDREDMPACVLLSIPGIYEILSEYFNNDIIDELENEGNSEEAEISEDDDNV